MCIGWGVGIKGLRLELLGGFSEDREVRCSGTGVNVLWALRV